MNTAKADLRETVHDFETLRKENVDLVIDQAVALVEQAYEEWASQNTELDRTGVGRWHWSKGKNLSDLIGERQASRIELAVARLNCEVEFEGRFRWRPYAVQCWARNVSTDEFPFWRKTVLIRFAE